MTRFEKALLSWTTLNAMLMDFSKSDAIKLLHMERTGKNRITFIKRIRQRVLGASTEELSKEYPSEEENNTSGLRDKED